MKHEWFDEKTKRWYPILDITNEKGVVLPARIQPFTPSNDQLIKYMKHKGHKVPLKKVKDDRKWMETGAQKELAKVYSKTKDKLYKTVLEYRGCETAISRYVDKWEPGLDGRVHSEFMYVPASGQLNSVNPNAQNFIKHGSKDGVDRVYADRLRGMVKAPKGFQLVEFDYAACHSLTTGFEARDKDYCVAPETKLLTNDLVWKGADFLSIGDELVGFDEFSPHKKGKKRGFKKSTIVGIKRLVRPSVKIVTNKGTLICSVDHMWLSKYSKNCHYRWVETGNLKAGNYIGCVAKPWESSNTWEEGYVSGILDGEGTTHQGQVSYAQNPGLVSDKVGEILIKDGFSAPAKHKNSLTCVNFAFTGEAFAGMRAIGKYKPVRLMAKFMSQLYKMDAFSKYSKPALIESVEFLGDREVIAIETTTKTFIAEGFMSHNCRLARLDMHSFVTAHFCYIQKLIKADELPELSWDDKKLGECLGEFKKRFPSIRDTKAKPAGLGYGFGMMANKLHRENEDTIPLKDAKLLMKLLDDLFPVAKEWRKQIKFLADRQGYLVSRHGFIRWFWDVFTRRFVHGKWDITNGSDAEDAIAFLPSNDGHCLIQGKMIELENLNVNMKFGLINMIHDALLYLMPESLIDEGIGIVKHKMVEPSLILVDPLVAPNGLSVGVDVKVGKSWDKMEKWVVKK